MRKKRVSEVPNENSQEELLVDIAHQLRNPLNNISINAELARLQLQKNHNPEDVILSIERILQECKRCGQLVNELSPAQ